MKNKLFVSTALIGMSLVGALNQANALTFDNEAEKLIFNTLALPVTLPTTMAYGIVHEPLKMGEEIMNTPDSAYGGVPEKLVKGVFAIPTGVTVGVVKSLPRALQFQDFMECGDDNCE